MLNVIMLNVIMLNVIVLNVVAPCQTSPKIQSHLYLQKISLAIPYSQYSLVYISKNVSGK